MWGQELCVAGRLHVECGWKSKLFSFLVSLENGKKKRVTLFRPAQSPSLFPNHSTDLKLPPFAFQFQVLKLRDLFSSPCSWTYGFSIQRFFLFLFLSFVIFHIPCEQ